MADSQALQDKIIRLHVVANSDTQSDQNVKLQVRDAVLKSIRQDMSSIADVEAARKYLQDNLVLIENVANETLASLGCEEAARVSLCREAFEKRVYDTFALPAGIYEALRITIGAGEGKNWWCVAFPTLCIPATGEAFEAAAVESGFSEPLSKTLAGEKGYRVRFFFLDALGSIQNFLGDD